MRKDAETHAEEDRKKREVVDSRNAADAQIWQTEKFIKENEAAIPEKDRTRIGAIVDRLKAARDKDDVEGMKQAMEELDKATQEAGRAIYEKAGAKDAEAQPSSSPPPESDGGGPDDSEEKIIDADYEVKE